MQSHAALGEVVVSETVYAAIADLFPEAQTRTLSLRGKESSVAVRVLRAA
jgi:class 3 adenylate cyclase